MIQRRQQRQPRSMMDEFMEFVDEVSGGGANILPYRRDPDVDAYMRYLRRRNMGRFGGGYGGQPFIVRRFGYY